MRFIMQTSILLNEYNPMENISEQITFEQAQSIISEGRVPDTTRFGFGLDFTQKWSHNYRGADGVSRTQKEYETNCEESLIHHALSAQNFDAVVVLINTSFNDIPYIKQTRFRIRTFKEDAHGPLITDSDCNQWSEWSAWTEEKESILIFAENMGAPASLIGLIREKLQSSTEDLLVENFKKAAIDPYKDKIVRARQDKESRQVSLYGFPNKVRVNEFEYKWQRQVTQRFFRIGMPLNHNKRSFEIYTRIKNHQDSRQTTPIAVDGLPRRSFIIALAKIMSEQGHMPELTFKIGITKIKLTRENSFANRQQGNFSMQVVPQLAYDIAYGAGLETRLNNFTKPTWDRSATTHDERQTQFLRLINRNLTQLIPFTNTDLNKYQNIKIDSDRETAEPSDERTKNNLHLLNALLFLITTVEILVRLYRTEDGHIYTYPDLNERKRALAQRSDDFPVAIAQSRSLSLLLEGQISFADFWGASMRNGLDNTQHRAYYGAVTGKETIDYFDVMMEKLLAINNLYNQIISNLSGWKVFSDTFKQSNKKGCVIEGRSRMYFDLKSGYGSGNESDPDSNYSDTEDSELDEIVTFHV